MKNRKKKAPLLKATWKTKTLPWSSENLESSWEEEKEDILENFIRIKNSVRRTTRKRRKEKKCPPVMNVKSQGHIRLDCPLLKKVSEKKKTKAMVATWSDSEASSSTEEEETTKSANLCLMGLENEVSSPELQTEFTYDELNSAFHDLLIEFKKAGVKIKSLKKQNDVLLKDKDEIFEKNNILQRKLDNLSESVIVLNNEKTILYETNNILVAKNIDLKKEVEKLKPLVEKLTLSSNKLELILKEQKDSKSKAGIGFNALNAKGISATKFVSSKASASNAKFQKAFPSNSFLNGLKYVPKNSIQKSFKPNISISASFKASKHASFKNDKIICYACHRFGHKSYQCNSLKNSMIGALKYRTIWVPKGTNFANPKGPKLAWVPKITP